MLYEVITVTFILKSPENNLVTIGQFNPKSDGSFERTFVAGGPVITSYSIHYTKLYDPDGRRTGHRNGPPGPPRRLLVWRMR